MPLGKTVEVSTTIFHSFIRLFLLIIANSTCDNGFSCFITAVINWLTGGFALCCVNLTTTVADCFTF